MKPPAGWRLDYFQEILKYHLDMTHACIMYVNT